MKTELNIKILITPRDLSNEYYEKTFIEKLDVFIDELNAEIEFDENGNKTTYTRPIEY